MRRSILVGLAMILSIPGGAAPTLGQPAVVATAEGQIGQDPAFGEKVLGARFEVVRGGPDEVILGGLSVPFLIGSPPPAFTFVLDQIHDASITDPVSVLDVTGSDLGIVPVVPDLERRRLATGGDLVSFTYVIDGAPGTMTIQVGAVDDEGTEQFTVPIVNISTFPDPLLNRTSVATDDQGRVSVVYTELPVAMPSQVRARRFAADGTPIGGELTIGPAGRGDVDVALLDPSGNRLIVTTTSGDIVRGNIVDTTGPTPVVLPEFPISTTPATFANINAVVAADPTTGAGIVAWENLSDLPGNPVDLYARRFDADGNPIGGDFRVNTTTADAQGQPTVAVDPLSGASVVAWAGDSTIGSDVLDTFFQVYDANGDPIGGETRANTSTSGFQDRPTIGFLPETDSSGRPRFVVIWRDVGDADGGQPNGTGRSYKCFAIDGLLPDPTSIFEDGFESGDTSSWSQTTQ